MSDPTNVSARGEELVWCRLDSYLLAGIAAVGAAVWLWFALSTHITLEDAYITFRYARNIAQGAGVVFNPGERVLGTTTPLQTLLLALLGRAFGPEKIPTIGSLLMPLFGAATGLLAYPTLLRFGLPRAGAVAGLLLFFLHPLVMRTSLGGMETPLVLFLMSLCLYFISRRQSVGATAAVALLALCRVDGLIWGALLVGATLLSHYRRPLRQVFAFAAIVLPWIVFATHYFGNPAPNSMLAKGVIRPGREYLLVQPEHFHNLSRWYLSGTGFPINSPAFFFWLALLALGIYIIWRAQRREVRLLTLFPPIYALLMYLGRAPMYQWYLLPMLFCCLLVGGVGAGWLIALAARKVTDRRLRLAGAVCALAILIPGLINLAGSLPRQIRHARLFQENEFGLRRGVGLWLLENTPQDATVAMEAIGYQGYFSQRRIIDMAGLVTPEVVKFKAATGSNGYLFQLIVNELQPDYIVLRSFEVDQNRHFNGGKLFEADADRQLFFLRYREAKRFTAPHPELAPLITHLTVYQRKR